MPENLFHGKTTFFTSKDDVADNFLSLLAVNSLTRVQPFVTNRYIFHREEQIIPIFISCESHSHLGDVIFEPLCPGFSESGT